MIPPFQVIIDCPFKSITKDSTLASIDKKYSVCMVNDFEDGVWNGKSPLARMAIYLYNILPFILSILR